jgi:hypothetical protein
MKPRRPETTPDNDENAPVTTPKPRAKPQRSPLLVAAGIANDVRKLEQRRAKEIKRHADTISKIEDAIASKLGGASPSLRAQVDQLLSSEPS